jgi:amino acid adenylation domain-containing protein
VRVRVDDERTVAALLSDLRAQRLSLRLHEHTPLEEIQGQCELPRDRPLFETLFTYDTQELNRTLRAGGDPRWSGRRFTLYEQPTLPLHITAVGAADRLELRALFDRARFRDSVVDRLLASFGATVDRLAQDEARPLGRIDVLPAGERDQLLRLWNDTARPFPDRLCLHEPFERRADRQPDAIAVETEAESLTYRALEERANRLAHLLRARGAGPGAYVGLCLDRGPELLVALLGILKSGSPYVALDPRYPAQRLAFMAADTGARLIVTERRHQALFPGTPKLVVDSDDAALELAAAPASRPERLSRAEDVCYAMFTSGSSGQPKAAALSHRAVMNTLDWVSRTFAVAPGDRLLFVTSPCFDLSVYDTLGVLGAGATVVVASQQMLADPVALAAALADRRITIWDSAPVALQRLLPFLPARTRESPLRLVLLSGDWIPLSLPDAVRSAFPSAEVQSLGGATEAAIWSNHFPIGAIDPDWTSIPYGRPIQNTRYHVLDAALRPVPIGVAGDLYIGGACLADGYVNRPELNAERFIPDPFAQPPGERLYLTGDRARYRHDGNLELLGRADLQVKIRGFRVEMGEVELALRAIPGVGQAVCAATAADAWGQRSLVAYLVPAAGATLDARSVREAVARQLPDFMVPSHVVVLPALPLSTNGKIDRRALPSPTTSPAPGREFVAPRTDLERRMIALWEDLLGRRPIGATDDFFELGGDSLLAVMLVSRVETGLGMALPLSTVLEHHTVETLVRALEAPTASTAPRRGPRRHLICLNAGGKGTPIVLLPGVGGHAFTFKDLPALLGREQPVYALSSIGAEAGTPLIDLTVEESAEIYEAEVLEAFPSGPIVVGGFSFGMLPAFELAHRLRQRGRSVPLMVSFDGFAPGYPRRMEGARRLLAHAGELLQSDPRRRGEYIEGQVAKLRVGLRRLLGKADETAPHLRFVDAEMRSRLQKVWDFNLRARDRYRPTHVAPDALLLIRCEIPMRWPATQMDCPMHGWYAFVRGPISVVTVPGEHLSLFAPENQQTIADTITQHLARYAPG